MVTYRLFKPQTMFLLATSRDGQPDGDLHPVQPPEHALIRYKQRKPIRFLTYILFKTQSMLLSATSREDQPDADVQPIQNPNHALVSNKQNGPARCWLTAYSTPTRCSHQKHSGRASHMLTYMLFKIQGMLLLATSSTGQPDANLHTVQNPEHAFVSNKQRRPATCWLTPCSTPRSCSCQQEIEIANWNLTYLLLKTKNMLLSATSRETLHAFKLTNYLSSLKVCSRQYWKTPSKTLTYILFIMKHILINI